VAGVEALLRSDHPERRPIAPSDFIPVGEDSGPIVALGERVLRDACCQVARWQAGTPASDLHLTVNVSARQMALSGLPGTVGSILRETGLAPTSLRLEITEGLLMEETPDDRDAAGAPADGRPAAARRLRHGLLLARLPAALSARRHRDRPRVRARPGGERAGRRGDHARSSAWRRR
jgi:hypothetical protein